MKTVFNSLGEKITINENSYFVTATDKFLSGWGKAEGKTAKRVIICDSYKQAKRMSDAFINSKEWKYINICCRIPKYNSQKYVVSYSHYDDFNNTTWMKYTNIPE